LEGQRWLFDKGVAVDEITAGLPLSPQSVTSVAPIEEEDFDDRDG